MRKRPIFVPPSAISIPLVGALMQDSDESGTEENSSSHLKLKSPIRKVESRASISTPSEYSATLYDTLKTGLTHQFVLDLPAFTGIEPNYPEPMLELNEMNHVTWLDGQTSHPMFGKVVYDSCDRSPLYDANTSSTLQFESRFESGNLRRVIQISETEYDMYLNPDYNTGVNTQWYFFRITGARKGTTYQLNLVNFVKPTSDYSQGMRPLMHSATEASLTGRGWTRCGTNISYSPNALKRVDRVGTNYYTLSFNLEIPHENDTIFLAHSYPYTYSDLRRYLMSLECDRARSHRVRRTLLCESLAGNACDLLTITNFQSDPAAAKAKRGVVVCARVHPGEAPASWMMKGLIDYLTGPSIDARILRDMFVFKIVPMLNPDGVILGNYRCNLAGLDLNRFWHEPSKRLQPTIYHAKQMIKRFSDERELCLFIDLHAHSARKNIFVFGNNENDATGYVQTKVYPTLLGNLCPFFSMTDSVFKNQKIKERSARVSILRSFGTVNAFTLEASFSGASFGKLSNTHFNTRHYEDMGRYICDALLDFFETSQAKVNKIVNDLITSSSSDVMKAIDDSEGEESEAHVPKKKKRAPAKPPKLSIRA